MDCNTVFLCIACGFIAFLIGMMIYDSITFHMLEKKLKKQVENGEISEIESLYILKANCRFD